MIYKYLDIKTGGKLVITSSEDKMERYPLLNDKDDRFLTIAWNRGKNQSVMIDEIEYQFPSNSILPLIVNQSFKFSSPENIITWQFSREFYCVVNHDKEVSCAGFVFYGSPGIMFIKPGKEESRKLESLTRIFIDEMETKDNIQGDMLRMLLVRLIIIITRLAKKQFIHVDYENKKHDMVRYFNLLVEDNFRKEHSVKFYAGRLNKSPKTLSNLFILYNQMSPSRLIQERILIEAKRLFFYTDKSSKEVAAELGFNDAAHFSRFFKKLSGLSPSEFKIQNKNSSYGMSPGNMFK